MDVDLEVDREPSLTVGSTTTGACRVCQARWSTITRPGLT